MTTDEMERMPHKRPDDELAKIVAEFAPRTREFVDYADTLGEDVFADDEVKTRFHDYRTQYEAALGEHFDRYVAQHELPESATEQDKFNARESFAEQSAEYNENEAVTEHIAAKTQGDSDAKRHAHQMRLETHFGTLRNDYLRDKAVAERQNESWVASSTRRTPREQGM
ncbi:MAG: hypothetical protein ACKVOE_01435 [Rickettsiales bacterium]